MCFEQDKSFLQCIEKKIEDLYASLRTNEMDERFFKSDNFFRMGKRRVKGELRFHRLISYLYQFYMERGSVNLKVLVDFSHLADINSEDMKQHSEIVHAFRTLFEHNLPEGKRYEAFRKKCQIWMRIVLNHNEPNGEEWDVCAHRMYTEAVSYLNMCLSVLERLRELNQMFIFEQWSRLQKKDIPHHRKIDLIKSILDDYQIPCDATALYRKNQMRFNDVMNMIDCTLKQEDFIHILRGRYETIIFCMDIWPCAISGKDVCDMFQLRPKELGDVMRLVNRFHEAEIRNGHYCGKEELLAYIKKILKPSSMGIPK